MFLAYLRIALRTTRRHGLYSALNVFGLAVGLAAFLLIVAFMRFELSYDDFHEKADRTFRVVKEDRGNYYLGSNRFAVTPAGLADAMVAEIPGVETATTIDDREALLTFDDTSFLESGLIATGTFFDVFSFPLLRGDPRTALVDPGSIILTSNLARRLFGEADPMGRRLRVTTYSQPYDVEVRGIVDGVPANSHLSFEYVVSMTTIPDFEERKAQWGTPRPIPLITSSSMTPSTGCTDPIAAWPTW